MRIAVYAPENGLPLVLTAECMQPSLDCVHHYGPLELKGLVSMDEGLLSEIGHPICALTGDVEFVIDAACACRTVEAHMELSGLNEPLAGLDLA